MNVHCFANQDASNAQTRIVCVVCGHQAGDQGPQYFATVHQTLSDICCMQMATISLDNNHFVGPLRVSLRVSLPDTWTTSENGVSLLSLTLLLSNAASMSLRHPAHAF